MTDVNRLKEVVRDSGLKKVYIAERLGITYQGYLKKENGENEFMASEIKTMQELLGLSAKDIREIFLS
jgi:DNA-binding XRE family transcriptional regulator